MRVAVYTDYLYRRRGDSVYAERAFALFLARLGAGFDEFTVVGRLAPGEGGGRYPLGDRVGFAPLPYYKSLSDPLPALRGMAGALRRFWRVLDEADAVWLLGPHPLAFAFAAMALARRRRVVLGVRQDLPRYTASRHPDSRLLRLAAGALEVGFRLLARHCPVVVVGPELAHHYRGSPQLLEVSVSLVDASEILVPVVGPLPPEAPIEVLSVGRLDREKNPLLLADVLARLVERDRRWRLVVCGEGSLADDLRERLRSLGVDGDATLRGYVPHEQLKGLYRESSMLLHVSWTEGVPQILYEAFAAALPVVATGVGGVAAASGEAATIVPPGDAEAAAGALVELAEREELRRHRVEAGHALVRGATIDRECRRVAALIEGRAGGD
jgi:glycosyltransferase involved in cell wall biosynthesis